ncbi:MAG TPA: response regulator, partial [Candidatus Udaeobacter sp.]|nr:response regulator [Candidatus Udaeobacter sp.]
LRRINGQLEDQYKNSEQKTKELQQTKLELEEKASQLALSSQYKSEFLANMSHELRTPLNSLLILSGLLAGNSEGNLKENQVKFAETIHSSGNDLLHLINDILDLSKVESGKIEIVPDEVSLTYICDFAELEFIQVADQRGLKFTTEIEDGLPATICTDAHRLMQILRNLLVNAFKFTEHGEVALRIHHADKEALADHSEQIHLESAVAFSITDTGIGIPGEKQSLIFQAFQQEDGTTSRKYGGTGLGLSICRELAHLLGGVIEVNSVKGKGSTFTLLLPGKGAGVQPEVQIYHEEAAVAHADFSETERQIPALPHEEALFAGKKVLIVDDDMRNIFAITTALESKRMKVVFAENGKDGIRVLQENPDIDLILMDIMLPEMDGYEAMRTLRQMPKYQLLPIIALTAKAMKEDKEKCLEAGASDYISKPVSLEQLFSLIQVWLYRQAG